MDEKELYERQYGEKLLSAGPPSFPALRRWLHRFDLSRHELALSLLRPGEALLDVGCGDGKFIAKAAPHFFELHGIDISQYRISEAEKKLKGLCDSGKKITLRQGNISSALPFADNTFDTVTCLAVIALVYDPYFLVKELRRVLKKDGVLIAEVPNVAYIKQRFRLLFGELPIVSTPHDWERVGWDCGHLHYFTKKTFCGLLRDCGFDVLTVTGSGFCAKLRNFYPALLTGDICVVAEKR